MRKLVAVVGVVCLMAGLVLAAEGTITKVDLDAKEIVIKEGDKETTYKFSEKLKVTLLVGKDSQEKEGKYEDFERRLKAFKANSKFGNRIVFEASNGELTEVKIRGRGGKN